MCALSLLMYLLSTLGILVTRGGGAWPSLGSFVVDPDTRAGLDGPARPDLKHLRSTSTIGHSHWSLAVEDSARGLSFEARTLALPICSAAKCCAGKHCCVAHWASAACWALAHGYPQGSCHGCGNLDHVADTNDKHHDVKWRLAREQEWSPHTQ